MRTDRDIERDVEAELRWDPDVDATDVAVAVNGGVVTLAGFVRSYAQRRQAEKAAKLVAGVTGLANDIEVRLPILSRKPDPEVARGLVMVLRRELPDIADSITVSVTDGWVTLDGAVVWQSQREKVEEVTRNVIGVRAITNAIQVAPRTGPSEIKRKIEDAFRRNAVLNAKRIIVESDGSAVTLKGTVQSWAKRDEAERVAWMAPGVTSVDDQITVDPNQPLPL